MVVKGTTRTVNLEKKNNQEAVEDGVRMEKADKSGLQ